MLKTLLASSVAVSTVSAACSPPAAGAAVTIQPCTGAGASVVWNWTSTNPATGMGSFFLGDVPSLCMSTGPIYPASQVPQVVVQPCNATDMMQRWAFSFFNVPNVWIYSGFYGSALDVFNNEVEAGTVVEVFGPNQPASANEEWTYSSGTGQLTTALNGFCAAVC